MNTITYIQNISKTYQLFVLNLNCETENIKQCVWHTETACVTFWDNRTSWCKGLGW